MGPYYLSGPLGDEDELCTRVSSWQIRIHSLIAASTTHPAAGPAHAVDPSVCKEIEMCWPGLALQHDSRGIPSWLPAVVLSSGRPDGKTRACCRVPRSPWYLRRGWEIAPRARYPGPAVGDSTWGRLSGQRRVKRPTRGLRRKRRRWMEDGQETTDVEQCHY